MTARIIRKKISSSNVDAKITTHTAVLDAHTKNSLEEYKIGYYPTPFFTGYNVGALVIPADYIYAIPVPIVRPVTIDGIACHCSTLEANVSARLGIYASSAMLPTNLVLDAGTVSLATAGQKMISISQALAKGIYWFCILSNATGTAQLYRYSTGAPNFCLNTTFGENTYNGYKVAQAYGALPATFPASPALNTNTFLVLPRIASLD